MNVPSVQDIVVAFVLLGLSVAALAAVFLHPWHVHAWEEVTRTFVEPMDGHAVERLVRLSQREKYATGFTVVLLKCTTCQKFHQEELQGHVHKAAVLPLKRVN